MASDEYEALRVSTAALNRTLTGNAACLNWLADRLLGEGFIGADVHSNINTQGWTNYQKASSLTTAVSSRVRTDPESFPIFSKFVEILQEEAAFVAAVKKILEEYGKRNPDGAACLREKKPVAAATGTTATSHQSTAKPLDLKTITNELTEVTDWHGLGVQLNVPPARLKKIEDECPNNTERRKSEVITYWLGNPGEHSWDTLADAVQRLELGVIAKRLRGYAGARREHQHGYRNGTSRTEQRPTPPPNVVQANGNAQMGVNHQGFTGAGRGHPPSSVLLRRPVHHTNGEGGYVTNGGQAGQGYGNGTSQRTEQGPPSHAVQPNGNAQRGVPHQGTSSCMTPVALGLMVVMVICGAVIIYKYLDVVAMTPQPEVAGEVPQPETSAPRTTLTHTDPSPSPDTPTYCHPITNVLELTKALTKIGNWEMLCQNLRVKDAIIANLRVSSEPAVNKKRQCLRAYIDQGDACWEEVIKVVADDPFYKVTLARDIAEKHGIDHRLLDEL